MYINWLYVRSGKFMTAGGDTARHEGKINIVLVQNKVSTLFNNTFAAIAES